MHGATIKITLLGLFSGLKRSPFRTAQAPFRCYERTVYFCVSSHLQALFSVSVS